MGTTTGVCPTVEQALAKVKDNLRANILVTDELASHIVDALTKVYTDQGTLEGTAALEQFLEIMSDNGKYTEAPKEIMDLIVLQLNTVYNVAPQCWNWAKKFVDMIRLENRPGEQEYVVNIIPESNLIRDRQNKL